MHPIAADMIGLDKWEDAERKRHSNEIANVSTYIIVQVHTNRRHICPLKGDISPLLLNGQTQNDLELLLTANDRMNHLEATTSADGSLQIVDREIFEIGICQRQEEAGVIHILTGLSQRTVKEAVAVQGIIELDQRRLKEISRRQPRIGMRGTRKNTVRRTLSIVFGTDGDRIIPNIGDIVIRIVRRCVEMVLQHQRDQLTLGLG